MRGYMELLDFMRDLADGIQEHLPEDQRTGQLSVEEIIDQWVEKKSYFAALSLRKDIATYAKLYEVGDYSVDQLLSDYDLCFIPERFGCDNTVFLAKVRGVIDERIAKKKELLLKKYFRWLGYK
ncbi:hypothetical protein D3C77_250520 [compost metagenome]